MFCEQAKMKGKHIWKANGKIFFGEHCFRIGLKWLFSQRSQQRKMNGLFVISETNQRKFGINMVAHPKKKIGIAGNGRFGNRIQWTLFLSNKNHSTIPNIYAFVTVPCSFFKQNQKRKIRYSDIHHLLDNMILSESNSANLQQIGTFKKNEYP